MLRIAFFGFAGLASLPTWALEGEPVQDSAWTLRMNADWIHTKSCTSARGSRKQTPQSRQIGLPGTLDFQQDGRVEKSLPDVGSRTVGWNLFTKRRPHYSDPRPRIADAERPGPLPGRGLFDHFGNYGSPRPAPIDRGFAEPASNTHSADFPGQPQTDRSQPARSPTRVTGRFQAGEALPGMDFPIDSPANFHSYRKRLRRRILARGYGFEVHFLADLEDAPESGAGMRQASSLAQDLSPSSFHRPNRLRSTGLDVDRLRNRRQLVMTEGKKNRFRARGRTAPRCRRHPPAGRPAAGWPRRDPDPGGSDSDTHETKTTLRFS